MTYDPHYIPPHASQGASDDPTGGGAKWLLLGGLLAWAGWKKLRGGASSGDQDDENPGIDRKALERGHEPEGQTNVFAVVGFSGALLVLLLMVLGGIAALQNVLKRDDPAAFVEPSSVGFQYIPPPAPHLQAAPALDLQALRQREDSLLHTYGWVDRSRATVRIPIEQAMDLIAERGLPHDTTGIDSVRVLTESGYVWMGVGQVPPPAAPAYPGPMDEPYAPSADVARRLGLVNTTTERGSKGEEDGS